MSKISDFLNSSARTNVEQSIAKARANEDFNAVLSLTEERALERADAVDRGDITGPLAGVPFMAKDNFLSFGSPTTAASRMLQNFEAPLQATAVEKLEDAGAICIGKVNLDAFAHGGSTENSAFGVTKNAADKTRVAGGSSGGSAVVTALGVVPFALGSDTGGSIRQPASYNGVIGVKPTYGAVSRFGVVAMASSTDTVGLFANSAADASLVMDIISGRDERDATSLPDFFVKPEASSKPYRIGFIKEFFNGIDPEVERRVSEYLDRLRAQGHEVSEVSLPNIKYSLPVYYIVTSAEVSSNLARYDGIRYGHRAEKFDSLDSLYGRSRDEGFVTENKRRIILGSYVLSSGFFDAYYIKAQKVRTIVVKEFNEAFEDYDILVGPVAPAPAPKIGEIGDDPIKAYMADILTAPASLAGLPAISLPAGLTDAGLPVGVQLIGRRCEDSELLSLAMSQEVN
jgi:aspartyl-tRNA(Asn)/glutamyl-tRNA(Gln) amidotransferase subunit A